MNDPQGRIYNMGGNRSFVGNSRANKVANNNLGVIKYDSSKSYRMFRTKIMDNVEKYLESKQYDHLAPWQECNSMETYTKIRNRKPSVIFPFAKTFQDRVAAKLVGDSTFPEFKIADAPDDSFFVNEVIRTSFFKAKMMDVAKDFVSYTSAFARFHLVNGSPKIEVYSPNYCYPELDSSGDLISIDIKYVYETNEFDPKTGKMICRWYKMTLTQTTDTLFDNPEYKEEEEPEFQVVDSTDHNLGFVQGEWFRWGENGYDVDGNQEPLVEQIKGFIDAINYNLSQSDSATSYGLDPQLVIKGMTEDDADTLIKSSGKAWMIGRSENEAMFLEVNGTGVKTAAETETRLMKSAANAARIVFLDPEKMVASAQSGKAMEVMNAPMVEMINEIRPWFERSMIKLIEKMVAAILIFHKEGAEIGFNLPEGYEPQSLDIRAHWPPIFSLTIQDMQQIVAIAIQAASGNIISRDTAAQWAQKMGVNFGVEDWEAERAKIDGQKQFNSFF